MTSVAAPVVVLEITKRLLEQWRLMGVFINSSNRVKDELDRLGKFRLVLDALAVLLAKHGIVCTPDRQPVVYNLLDWPHAELSGYTDELPEVSFRQTVISRIERWCLSFENVRANRAHFLKCAIWYAEKQGGDALAGLRFLCDLFTSGYFADLRQFSEVMENYLKTYSSGSDLSCLRGTSISDIATINRFLQDFSTTCPPADPDRLNDLVDALVGQCEILVDVAKDASCLDEWWTRTQEASGLLFFLSSLHHNPETKEFGVATRALLSRIEEMGADVHAVEGTRSWLAEHFEPVTWDLERSKDIIEGYKRHFGKEAWFDRLVNDRLYIPRACGEYLDKHSEGFVAWPLPAKWRLASSGIATPVFTALGLMPECVRVERFDGVLLRDWMRRHPDQLSGSDSPEVQARKIMLQQERQLYRVEMQIVEKDPLRTAGTLQRVRRLYPYMPMADVLSSRLALEQNNISEAARFLERAVMLEPWCSLAWFGLAAVAERTGDGTGKQVFASIAAFLTNHMEKPHEGS